MRNESNAYNTCFSLVINMMEAHTLVSSIIKFIFHCIFCFLKVIATFYNIEVLSQNKYQITINMSFFKNISAFNSRIQNSIQCYFHG